MFALTDRVSLVVFVAVRRIVNEVVVVSGPVDVAFSVREFLDWEREEDSKSLLLDEASAVSDPDGAPVKLGVFDRDFDDDPVWLEEAIARELVSVFENDGRLDADFLILDKEFVSDIRIVFVAEKTFDFVRVVEGSAE